MASRMLVRVCSFIPDEWIFFAAAPLVGVRKIEFEGDHRGFTPFTAGTSRFRTAQEFAIDFDKRKITYRGESGVTRARVLWQNGKVTAHAAQVKPSCLTFADESWNIGSVTFRARSRCANPLIPGAPAADYDFIITAWRNGQVRVTGRHDGFPAFEVYKKRNNVFTAVYLFDPYDHEQSLVSLYPPMEFSVQTIG